MDNFSIQGSSGAEQFFDMYYDVFPLTCPMKLEDKFINLLLEKLPEDKVTEMKILVEVGDKKRIQDFIGTLLPEIDKIISDNLDRLKI